MLSGQGKLELEDIRAYRIPAVSDALITSFTRLFNYKEKLNYEVTKKYKAAENALLNEIGLSDFDPSDEGVNIKSFSESFGTSGRFDAEYYQPKYEQVVEHIKSANHDTLNNIVTIKKSIEPGSDAYDDEGLPFLRVSDYSKLGLTAPDKKLSNEYCQQNAKTINRLKPKKDTILFSKDGSVGIAYHLTQDMDLITSGAILHLNIKDKKALLPEYLTLVLNSQLVQMQAERDAGGSIILHWRVGEIENVVVPVLDFDKQTEISQLVRESFILKAKSEKLLDIAKRAVEIAIEEDETSAEAYIKTECQSLGVSLGR
ncbi:MAG: restriction endonuclease subunit S [Rhodospirillales bacterium]|nr:restriction endonuclease subunit S [Rhodospirillales bacterium]